MNSSLIGIAETSSEIAKSALAGELKSIGDWALNIKDYIFHFGFQPRPSLAMLYHYFVIMFYWLFWPAAAGAIIS